MKIKGVNLGGWLLMEGYILHGRNIPESGFKAEFRRRYGEKGLREFERLFRDNFIREDDLRNIAAMGATAIRVPFNCRLIETKPRVYSPEGFSYLDRVLDGAQRHGLKVILDLHAAPGAQNCDWHGDSSGKALLWVTPSYRERTYDLWERIADHCKDHPALAGYDVLNEPVMDPKDVRVLKEFYKHSIRRIKAVDKKHTLFLEGNIWAQQIDFLADLLEDNVTVSIHYYLPLFYTFNFTPFTTFPGKVEGERWDEGTVRRSLEPYRRFAAKNGIRIFVGEFGINWRGGFWGERTWLRSVLSTFDDLGFDYTYWTYKAIANSVFPDGLYQYLPDSAYVRREGPVHGFENYYGLWKTDKEKIVDFWRTGNYRPNGELIDILKKHFKK